MRTGAARGCIGNFHEAGFYDSDEQFLALILPFVTEGLDAGEPVVIGYDTRKCDLLRAALPRQSAVNFIADKSLYASPARAIEAYRRQFDRHLAAGAGQIRIAGDVPHEGNGGVFAGWDRYESAVNVVWQDYPVWSRCLYDARTVSDLVRDVVERTHPRLVAAGAAASPSRRYQDVDSYKALPVAVDSLQDSGPALVLTDPTPEEVRNRLAQLGHGRIGITTLEELLFAATEAVLNAQQYGLPPTTVITWAGTDRMVVSIHDTGSGPVEPLTGLVPAHAATTSPGLGLWLSHQLAHIDIALLTDPTGFTVQLRAGRPPGHAVAAGATLHLRAGTAHGAPAGPGGVHAIDGDGSSFCDQVGPAGLVPLDGLLWPDVADAHRCPHCQLVTSPYHPGNP